MRVGLGKYEGSPIGTIVLGATQEGLALCATGDSAAELMSELQSRGAEFCEVPSPLEEAILERVKKALSLYFSGELSALLGIPLVLLGTDFQKIVWNALLSVRGGELASYKSIAEIAEKPDAIRAVGLACRMNPLHLFIPCHRVVSIEGESSGYRGGVAVKEWLLKFEREYHSDEIHLASA